MHEAGHAALAILLGLKFDRVTTVLNRFAGRVSGVQVPVGRIERFGRGGERWRPPPGVRREGLERRAGMYLVFQNAGVAAETAYLGDSGWAADAARPDFADAVAAMAWLYGGDRAAAVAHVRFVEAEMPAIMADPVVARCVLDVAAILDRTLALDYRQVKDVVRGACCFHRGRGGWAATRRLPRFPGLSRWLGDTRLQRQGWRFIGPRVAGQPPAGQPPAGPEGAGGDC
jgi:hypothetical protein